MWEKIETFLFDIIGLLIPGLVFLMSTIFTFLFLVSDNIYLDVQENLNKIVLFDFIMKTTKELNKHFWLIVVIFILISYLTGHVIKVFSKIYYKFFELIFDKFLNKIFAFLKSQLLSLLFFLLKKLVSYVRRLPILNNMNPALKSYIKKFFIEVKNYLKSVIRFIDNFLIEIFVYGTEDYEKANKDLLDECMDIINRRFNTNFPKKWYSIYKLSKIVIYHENLKNMNDTFLAKYNFYRSLSFISFLQMVLLTILSFNKDILNDYFNVLIPILLIINFIFWYTFHEKYKRYYRLCGNEILVAMYYYLKKTEQNSN
jgi:hypothetical protein